MKNIIKILGIFIGTMFVGLGVSLYKLSSLGQDSLSGMILSIQYLINIEKISYTVCYIVINSLFLIMMILFARNKINVGSIINLLLTGTFCDIFMHIFGTFNMLNPNLFLRIIYGILGLIIISFGIALYGGANLGIAPYDSLPLIVNKYCPKLKYKYARMLIDLSCTVVALIIGVIILKRNDIININTILTFIVMGPLISIFSKLINRFIYHNESVTFN